MKLTPEQKKRIEIAKDALKHLKAGRIAPWKGAVMVLPQAPEGHYFEVELQPVLKELAKKGRECLVCQRGALLYAHVYKNDNFCLPGINSNSFGSFVSDTTTRDTDHTLLLQFFSEDQLSMMERAFEGEISGKTHPECIAFYKKYESPRNRMKAILNNIIKNNGTFTI